MSAATRLSKGARIVSLAAVLSALGLPLAGVTVMGEPVCSYLAFPPLTRHVKHADFSWIAFILFAAVNLVMLAGAGGLLRRAFQKTRWFAHPGRGSFPVWGWAGLMILAGGWILAWKRFSWFAPLQGHTFVLPWIGYIVLANALCLQRSGRCPLSDNPRRFLLLFPVSALFWWYFEYLNRFVENWYYVGPMDFGPLGYTFFASLAFATVLPAVLSTYRLLLTFNTFGHGLDGLTTLPRTGSKTVPIVVLALSGAGLFAIGIFPDYLYALVWSAPLLIISALQALAGRATLFSFPAAGDWRPIITTVTSALICGFFWELWNFGSLVRWEYAVPFVDRFHIFAMPILGYGGYLPFGLECLVVCRWILPEAMVFPWRQAPM